MGKRGRVRGGALRWDAVCRTPPRLCAIWGFVNTVRKITAWGTGEQYDSISDELLDVAAAHTHLPTLLRTHHAAAAICFLSQSVIILLITST